VPFAISFYDNVFDIFRGVFDDLVKISEKNNETGLQTSDAGANLPIYDKV
jgi:hypothetical protein